MSELAYTAWVGVNDGVCVGVTVADDDAVCELEELAPVESEAEGDDENVVGGVELGVPVLAAVGVGEICSVVKSAIISVAILATSDALIA